jgi:hypothetical protein
MFEGHDQSQVPGVAHLAEDLDPEDRVPAQDLPLRIGRGARLVDELLRDLELPQVVEQAGRGDLLELPLGQREHLDLRQHQQRDIE